MHFMHIKHICSIPSISIGILTGFDAHNTQAHPSAHIPTIFWVRHNCFGYCCSGKDGRGKNTATARVTMEMCGWEMTAGRRYVSSVDRTTGLGAFVSIVLFLYGKMGGFIRCAADSHLFVEYNKCSCEFSLEIRQIQ